VNRRLVPAATVFNRDCSADRYRFDPLGEIEQSLALDVNPRPPGPSAWGEIFSAPLNLFADALLLFERGVHDRVPEPVPVQRAGRSATAAAVAESCARQMAR